MTWFWAWDICSFCFHSSRSIHSILFLYRSFSSICRQFFFFRIHSHNETVIDFFFPCTHLANAVCVLCFAFAFVIRIYGLFFKYKCSWVLNILESISRNANDMYGCQWRETISSISFVCRNDIWYRLPTNASAPLFLHLPVIWAADRRINPNLWFTLDAFPNKNIWSKEKTKSQTLLEFNSSTWSCQCLIIAYDTEWHERVSPRARLR